MARIILFDVDQTLLYSGGAGSLAMRRAFHQLYGIDDAFRRVEYSGRTDIAILRDAMRQSGLLASPEAAPSGRRASPEAAASGRRARPETAASGRRDGRVADFPNEVTRFQEAYYGHLESTLHEVDGGRTMPGVPELLAALSARDGARQGLATGNFRRAAFMKLRHFGLDGYLAEGGFADDAEDRGELVAIAIRRLADGAKVDPASVWVVGDTLLDIEAARANGARVLAVATGSTPAEALRTAGADLVLADLSDREAVLAGLLG